MRVPSTITKICQRCDQRFEIPNIRISHARDTLLVCYPCTHCGYSQCDPSGKSGRCVDCNIPFNVIDHQAQGRCNRDYMRMIRAGTG